MIVVLSLPEPAPSGPRICLGPFSCLRWGSPGAGPAGPAGPFGCGPPAGGSYPGQPGCGAHRAGRAGDDPVGAVEPDPPLRRVALARVAAGQPDAHELTGPRARQAQGHRQRLMRRVVAKITMPSPRNWPRAPPPSLTRFI